MAVASAHLQQLQALLPVGPAWPREAEAQLTSLLSAFAQGFADLDERALQLIDEALPSTTHEVLPDWERIAGLPDECTGPSETIEGRRLRLIQQLAEHGGQSRAFFLSAAASLGYPGCTITEFRPFTATSECDDPLDPDPWRFAWRLNVPAGADVRPFTAQSPCDEPIQTWGSSALECVISRLQPAQGQVIFAYVDP